MEGSLTHGFTSTKRSTALLLPALSLIYPRSTALLCSAGEPQTGMRLFSNIEKAVIVRVCDFSQKK